MTERHPIDLPDNYDDDTDHGSTVIGWVALSLVLTVLFVCAVFLWGYQA